MNHTDDTTPPGNRSVQRVRHETRLRRLRVLRTSRLTPTLLRVTLGPGRHHPLAPAIAGGLVGLVTVGLFDSLLDMPRLAFLFYFMLLLGLTLRARGASTFARPGAAVAQNPPSDRAVAA